MSTLTPRTRRSLEDPALYRLAAALLAAALPAVLRAQAPQAALPPGADTSLLELFGGAKTPEPFWVELAKLVTAGVVGTVVTLFYRQYQRDRPPSRSIMQAQVLLCVSGALMMIIIGNSTARALGIAGGASIIRFRTPVDDPRDTIMMFLLMGLGMAVGLGGFAVCGVGAGFLCALLAVLDHLGERKARQVFLDIVATSKDFPAEHVYQVLMSETEAFEQVKLTHGNEAAARYSIKINPAVALTHLSARLMDEGRAGIRSVAWEHPKKPTD